MVRPKKPEHIQVKEAETKIAVGKHSNKLHFELTLSIEQEERLGVLISQEVVRLKAVTTKLGVLLWLHMGLTDFGDEAVRDAVIGIGRNRNLNKYLSPTDRPNGGQLQLPF